MRPGIIDDLKQALAAVWSLVPQSWIDKLYQRFTRRKELCLVNEGLSTSNQHLEVTDRDPIKSFFMVSWTSGKYEQLFHGCLTKGPK